jgi:hypothetical protein
MSEHEKRDQIGHLAEECSHVRGKLNHIMEKLNRVQAACNLLNAPQVFQNLRAHEGRLQINQPQYQQQWQNIEGLIGYKELVELVQEKQHLTHELETLKQRLQNLAPHLFQ